MAQDPVLLELDKQQTPSTASSSRAKRKGSVFSFTGLRNLLESGTLDRKNSAGTRRHSAAVQSGEVEVRPHILLRSVETLKHFGRTDRQCSNGMTRRSSAIGGEPSPQSIRRPSQLQVTNPHGATSAVPHISGVDVGSNCLANDEPLNEEGPLEGQSTTESQQSLSGGSMAPVFTLAPSASFGRGPGFETPQRTEHRAEARLAPTRELSVRSAVPGRSESARFELIRPESSRHESSRHEFGRRESGRGREPTGQQYTSPGAQYASPAGQYGAASRTDLPPLNPSPPGKRRGADYVPRPTLLAMSQGFCEASPPTHVEGRRASCATLLPLGSLPEEDSFPYLLRRRSTRSGDRRPSSQMLPPIESPGRSGSLWIRAATKAEMGVQASTPAYQTRGMQTDVMSFELCQRGCQTDESTLMQNPLG